MPGLKAVLTWMVVYLCLSSHHSSSILRPCALLLFAGNTWLLREAHAS
jgi:hypothetical protein